MIERNILNFSVVVLDDISLTIGINTSLRCYKKDIPQRHVSLLNCNGKSGLRDFLNFITTTRIIMVNTLNYILYILY